MTVTASVTADPWLAAQLGVPAFHLAGGDPRNLPPGPSFVDARIPAGDIVTVSALEDAGFHVVDTAVTVELAGRDLLARGGDVGFAEPDDEQAIDHIAAGALTLSRFHLDPLINDSVASALKSAWARSYFSGGRGDWLVVGRDAGEVTGFLLLLDRPHALVIDLLAVAPAYQGAGIGRAMVAFAAAHCGNAPLIRAGTQAANIGSLRFYESLGFRVVRTEHVLHWHGQ